MKLPILSIIVANYNNTDYLEECLSSILDQTYKEIEIILIDDCSTDNSSEIIRDYERQYPDIFRCIFFIENKGVAHARHEAILMANGDYITTLDSDDYYLDPKKLEKEMSLIADYQKKGLEIVAFSNIMLVDGDGKNMGNQ